MGKNLVPKFEYIWYVSQCGILLIITFIMPWESTKTMIMANAKPSPLRCQAESTPSQEQGCVVTKNCLTSSKLTMTRFPVSVCLVFRVSDITSSER